MHVSCTYNLYPCTHVQTCSNRTNRGYCAGVAPRASGLAASAGDHLQGSNCSKVTLEGAFQDFSLFVYICIGSVLTFQTWMVLYISVNCLLFLSP